MVEFTYCFPRKVIFGANACTKIPYEIVRLAKPKSRVLVVTDKNIANAGIADRVISPITENGHMVEVFDQISGEPLLATAETVTDFVRAGKFDVAVGVGGGSCMDMAKIASVAATNSKPIKDYFAYMEDRIESKPLPKILIPTTAGTGSEATTYAVVIEEKFKNFINSTQIVADVSVLDPSLMISCPPKQTAGSGLDALSQSIEAYLSLGGDFFSDTFAIRAVELIAPNLRRAYHHGDDLESRSAMALAAFYGGVAISTAAGVILGHCISETIGPRFKIPHGLACGIVLPYIIKFNIPAAPEKIASLLSHMSDENVTGATARAEKVVNVIARLAEDLDVSLALKDYGISKGDLKEIVTFIATEQQQNYALPSLNPRIITESNISSMFDEMWEGTL
ncbi:MAG: iron-containing alcohol dehydrogenase [Candidatus Bathyarchaeia archaeon]